MGFTNRLAIYICIILAAGLLMSFYLAIQSIEAQYLGSLACWTVVFSPMSVGIDIVLKAVVDKSKEENKGPNGEGIRYSQLMTEATKGECDI